MGNNLICNAKAVLYRQLTFHTGRAQHEFLFTVLFLARTAEAANSAFVPALEGSASASLFHVFSRNNVSTVHIKNLGTAPEGTAKSNQGTGDYDHPCRNLAHL